MGYAGIRLAVGDSFEYQIIIDTPLAVTTTGAAWAGEPLEAWQLHRPRNLAVVCSPGGEYVAVFEPDAQE